MIPSQSLRRLLALAVLPAMLLGAACSEGGERLDVVALEADISSALTTAYQPSGYTLFEVWCPRSAASSREGDVFACVADVERQFVRVRVDATGIGGYDWTTLDLVLDMTTTENVVAAEMSERLNDTITLECASPELRVLPIGSTMHCTATDSGRNAVDALLTVDGIGQISWELLR